MTENADPAEYVRKNGLSLMTDAAAIEDAVKRVIAENEKSVSQYRDGKTQAFQYLIGQCMRALGGKAPAAAVTEALKKADIKIKLPFCGSSYKQQRTAVTRQSRFVFSFMPRLR